MFVYHVFVDNFKDAVNNRMKRCADRGNMKGYFGCNGLFMRGTENIGSGNMKNGHLVKLSAVYR